MLCVYWLWLRGLALSTEHLSFFSPLTELSRERHWACGSRSICFVHFKCTYDTAQARIHEHGAEQLKTHENAVAATKLERTRQCSALVSNGQVSTPETQP